MLDPKCTYRKSIFAKFSRLACLLSFASLFFKVLFHKVYDLFIFFSFQACRKICFDFFMTGFPSFGEGVAFLIQLTSDPSPDCFIGLRYFPNS